MSKEQFISILDSAFENGQPFIDYTPNYIYCLIPLGDGNWKEASYDLIGGELDERTLDSEKAFRMLIEEVEKGLAMEVEDFMLKDFRAFRTSVEQEDIPADEKVKKIINELLNNGDKYSKNLPIVKSAADIDTVKGKLK